MIDDFHNSNANFTQEESLDLFYTFEILNNPSIDEISKYWKQLEILSDQSFFIRWNWIGNWLKTFKPERYFLIIAKCNIVVGLAILVTNTRFDFGVVPIKQILLHRTELNKQDDIWIEYNDFLLSSSLASITRKKMFEFICENIVFDEFVVGASSENVLNDMSALNILDVNLYWKARSYNVKALGGMKKNFVSTLSRNTRAQFSRSVKIYKSITFEFAEDVGTGLNWLGEISILHQKKWRKSGFICNKFYQFHASLIESCLASKSVDIIKFKLSESSYVYLYNFILNDVIYFYLSAINNFETDNKAKPGLIAHVMAIEYYRENGFDVYDFMGGESRFKSSLANDVHFLYVYRFQRKSFYFKFLSEIRKIRCKMKDFLGFKRVNSNAKNTGKISF